MIYMQTIGSSTVIEVPAEVAICPYCDAPLKAQAEAWEQTEGGDWVACQIDLQCQKEPDIDTAKWDHWLATHTYMPYVYWLPVDRTVLAWVNRNYRFQMD